MVADWGDSDRKRVSVLGHLQLTVSLQQESGWDAAAAVVAAVAVVARPEQPVMEAVVNCSLSRSGSRCWRHAQKNCHFRFPLPVE